MWFEAAKIVHMIAVCMMVGGTLCNGVLHVKAIGSGKASFRIVVLENVMHINRLIMAPSFILIFASGFAMVYSSDLSLTDQWLMVSITFALVVSAEFIVGYTMEKKLEEVAETELRNNLDVPSADYWKLVRQAVPVGGTATILSIVIIFLMVVKPEIL